MNKKELFKVAKVAMQNSYAPYSNFNVGAALLCDDDSVFIGCNVENASYSVTCCAERSALFSAISAGKYNFKSIMIVGGLNGKIENYTFPCGTCRQALSEFCNDDFIVMIGKSESEIKEYTLGELLPCSFNKSNLNGDQL